MTDDCFICRKHRGQIEIPGGLLFEDDLVVVSRPANIDYPAYLMLDTRRHVWELADLTAVESEAVGRTVSRMARALRDICGVVHVYSFFLADAVPHAHFHIVGRYPGTPTEFWGRSVTDWPGAPRAALEELEALAVRLRHALVHP